MKKDSKIYVAGHRGLVGSAIVQKLQNGGYQNLLLKTREELDLLDALAVVEFFKTEKPEYVFLAAAKVGGILANKKYPAEFILENLTIQNNVIHNAHLSGVKKLLFLGSSCIYPKLCPQPIKEEYLLTGPLEESNEAYALAKIAGILMCLSYRKQYGSDFISVMPTNIYGENDNFDLETAHVFPALVRKFAEAVKEKKDSITLWGTGSPKREFLHADDLADACLFLMDKYDGQEPINIGTGEDISIKDFALLLQKISGFIGKLEWDNTKPDGTPRKVLDVSRLHALGWKHTLSLEQGARKTYESFSKNSD